MLLQTGVSGWGQQANAELLELTKGPVVHLREAETSRGQAAREGPHQLVAQVQRVEQHPAEGIDRLRPAAPQLCCNRGRIRSRAASRTEIRYCHRSMQGSYFWPYLGQAQELLARALTCPRHHNS